MRFSIFAGIKEHEFSNNLFPLTCQWSKCLNLKVFFFSFLKYRMPCKGYIMPIKSHLWMHLCCIHYFKANFLSIKYLYLIQIQHSHQAHFLWFSTSNYIHIALYTWTLINWVEGFYHEGIPYEYSIGTHSTEAGSWKNKCPIFNQPATWH